uniref:Uncharacterized protein n=1 Tax=Nelumbo nucifera TaxID=4432 RepID=A0A822Y5C7_NELNU|nr:TPA_asm: hypothetical protein HUJ06_027713 [Nelumbo nucifera]
MFLELRSYSQIITGLYTRHCCSKNTKIGNEISVEKINKRREDVVAPVFPKSTMVQRRKANCLMNNNSLSLQGNEPNGNRDPNDQIMKQVLMKKEET